MPEQENLESWKEEYVKQKQENASYDRLPKFSVGDGEAKVVELASDGKRLTTRFGQSILFEVVENGVRKSWWVKPTQFTILDELSKHAKLIGKRFSVMRMGKTQKDTRYSIKEVGV